MAQIDILEIHALLKLMENSEAIKAMDPFALYKIIKEVQNSNAEVIEKVSQILLREQANHEKNEKKFQQDVIKAVNDYDYKVNAMIAKTSFSGNQQPDSAEGDAEKILKSIIA